MLAGKITTDAGIVMTPTHAQTHGRRYRYYVERRRGDAMKHVTRPIRLPASEIEASIRNELASFLSDPIKLIDGLDLSGAQQEVQSAMTEKAKAIAAILTLPTLKQTDKVIVRRLVKSVTLEPDAKGYVLAIDLRALAKMLELSETPNKTEAFRSVQLELRVCNNGKKVIIHRKPLEKPEPNAMLIVALKSAHEIKAEYMNADGRSMSKIASQLNMDARQVWRTLKLAYLAPDIQLAILSGTQPKGLLLKDLLYQTLPAAWDKQRSMLDFE